MTPEYREAIRSKLAKLSDADLAKRLYLIGLVIRIDNELLAMKTLFGAGDEPLRLTPAPDGQITTLQHLMMMEIKQRASATTQRGDSQHENGTH